uniref:Uncharacterized protein n=1 Tax=Oryza glumipatula TaxID=40148 RepID=A0A0D9ZA76_9ORYZ
MVNALPMPAEGDERVVGWIGNGAGGATETSTSAVGDGGDVGGGGARCSDGGRCIGGERVGSHDRTDTIAFTIKTNSISRPQSPYLASKAEALA